MIKAIIHQVTPLRILLFYIIISKNPFHSITLLLKHCYRQQYNLFR